MTLQFPDGFRWGAATASYQIEGAANEDGRGPSIWDVFSHTPGKVADDHNGDVACDHYHRYREDVALMADLGLRDYRFSIAWPRVQPDGTGVEPRGLDFYSRLVDELLERGIRPVATLYHWDLPAALDWRDRDIVARFADYTQIVHDKLGDRVSTWTTFNEPWVSAFVGYASGRHAPGLTDPAAAFTVAHHLLLSHFEAVRVLRAGGAQEVSITLNLTPAVGDSEVATLVDGLANRLFLDPVLRGGYPDDMRAHIAKFVELDWDLPHAPIDVLGVNYYTIARLAADPASPGNPEYPGSEGIRWLPPEGVPTEMDWEVIPTGLEDLLVRLTRDYPGTPLMITENGAAYEDTVVDGQVPDDNRIAFLDGHFRAAWRAMERGADLRGYLVWSLLDNFEWARGYHKRFGLIRVDYDTLERLPKASAHWYREVIARNGLE